MFIPGWARNTQLVINNPAMMQPFVDLVQQIKDRFHKLK
jgi:hypothetical protein